MTFLLSFSMIDRTSACSRQGEARERVCRFGMGIDDVVMQEVENSVESQMKVSDSCWVQFIE